MKIQKHDFAKTIHVCPNGCHAALSTTAHVKQDWKVDLGGNFIEVLDDALEMVCLPDDDNIWTCLKCGEEAELYMARGFHIIAEENELGGGELYMPDAVRVNGVWCNAAEKKGHCLFWAPAAENGVTYTLHPCEGDEDVFDIPGVGRVKCTNMDNALRRGGVEFCCNIPSHIAVTFCYGGKKYRMTRDALRAANEFLRYENLLEDARVALSRKLFDADELPNAESEEYKAADEKAQKEYHRSIANIFSEPAIEALAASYQQSRDYFGADQAENDVWDASVHEFVEFLRKTTSEENDFSSFGILRGNPTFVKEEEV